MTLANKINETTSEHILMVLYIVFLSAFFLALQPTTTGHFESLFNMIETIARITFSIILAVPPLWAIKWIYEKKINY